MVTSNTKPSNQQNQGTDDTAKSPSVTKKIEGEEGVSSKDLKLLGLNNLQGS
jgi:hypothetical protein